MPYGKTREGSGYGEAGTAPPEGSGGVLKIGF